MDGLYYYKLVSEYAEDITKNCKLTINEIDSNFKTLKDNDIVSAEFVREDKTLVLTKNNNEKIIVKLDDIAYDLDVKSECDTSGMTLTFSYDGKNGKETVVVENVLTADNLMQVIGSEILTKVITDGTLKGNGTVDSPLGIKGVEKTGMLAPAVGLIDITCGGKLPEAAKLGTRYVTKEFINDYGYLYNGAGLAKITTNLSKDCRGWRIPTKADWDALLNSIEPCEYRNHNSSKCHVELGKVAGKYLKSECGWLGQQDCSCTVTKPQTGCSANEQADNYVQTNSGCGCMGGDNSNAEHRGCRHNNGDMVNNTTTNGWYDVNCTDVPFEKCEAPDGIDKFGMGILPAGSSVLDVYGRPQANYFKEHAYFWTSSHVYGDSDQDLYVKDFSWNKGGVSQVAECPNPYYSVRLVKDYNGSNYFGSEYINGILYETILFPESGQIWLATNFASKQGFIEYKCGGQTPELVEVNNGEVIEKRKELFINEWNGFYWEKKLLHEGDTIVIENPCFDGKLGKTTEINWVDSDGVTHTIEVEIPSASQNNMEYRVFTSDVNCDKELVNTDDLVVERVVNIVVPFIEEEREERIKADEVLSGAIETEREERISGDTEIWNALNEEISARTEADEALNEKIDAETARAISAETALDEKIDAETARATSAETEIWNSLNEEIERATARENEIEESLNNEIERAISAETALDEKIDAEAARAISAETEIWNALNEEISARTEADEVLSGAIETEREERISADEELEGKLIDTSKEYILKVTEGLVLQSNDGNPEHFVTVKFDGNFGEI